MFFCIDFPYCPRWNCCCSPLLLLLFVRCWLQVSIKFVLVGNVSLKKCVLLGSLTVCMCSFTFFFSLTLSLHSSALCAHGTRTEHRQVKKNMNKRTKEFFTRTEIRTNATRNSNTCQLTHKKKQCLKQRRKKKYQKWNQIRNVCTWNGNSDIWWSLHLIPPIEINKWH